jgi:hypothetical protein
MNSTSDLERWSGIARVMPRPGNNALGDARGAFVGIAALARDEQDFRGKVAAFLSALDFELDALEDMGPIRGEGDLARMDADTREKVCALSISNPLTYGSFHSFE